MAHIGLKNPGLARSCYNKDCDGSLYWDDGTAFKYADGIIDSLYLEAELYMRYHYTNYIHKLEDVLSSRMAHAVCEVMC